MLEALGRFYAESGGRSPLGGDVWNTEVAPHNRAARAAGARHRLPYPTSQRVLEQFNTFREAWRELARDWPPPNRRHECLAGGVVVWKPGEQPGACIACREQITEANSDPVGRPWDAGQPKSLRPWMHELCHIEPCRFCRRYTKAQLAYLRERAGKVSLVELTDEMNARWPERAAPFTPASLKLTARRRLKLSTALDDGGWTMRDFEDATGAWHHTAVLHWIEPGLLRAVRRAQLHALTEAGRKRPEWRIRPDDWREFLERYPWAYDWQALKEPWRSLGMRVWAAHPLATLDQLRRFLRRDSLVFWHRPNGVDTWARFYLRKHNTFSSQGEPLFELAELPRIRARMEELRKERVSAAMKQRARTEPGYGRKHFWSRTCRACKWQVKGRLESTTPPARCPKCDGWLRPGRPRVSKAA